MILPFRLNKAVTLKNSQDDYPKPVTDAQYEALLDGEGRDLMTESVSLEQIEATYFYDTPLHFQATSMLEAISTNRARLSNTMRAFIRALGKNLNGTNITAGNDTAGAADDGSQVIGGANIGRARNAQGIAVLPAVIPLSDGQTVTVMFHSPTADKKIGSQDVLVAFQFLLNKKDVTHVVAPMGGQDMSLTQVTLSLSNLIEKNTAKFQKAQKRAKAVKAEISDAEAEADKFEAQITTLSDQGDELKSQASALQKQVDSTSKQADDQEAANQKLQDQLDALQAQHKPTVGGATEPGAAGTGITDQLRQVKQNMNIAGQHTLSDGSTLHYMTYDLGDHELRGTVYIKTPTGDLYRLDSESSQGGAMEKTMVKLFKAYKEGKADKYRAASLPGNQEPPASAEPEPQPEPQPDPVVEPQKVDEPEPAPEPTPAEQQPQLYWYGLKARPMGISAAPRGVTEILEEDEAEQLPVVAARGFTSSQYRYGAIAYDKQLSAEQVAKYELVDFQNAETQKTAMAKIELLEPLIRQFITTEHGDYKEFFSTYLKAHSPREKDVPDDVKSPGFMTLGKLAMQGSGASNVGGFFETYFNSIKAKMDDEQAEPQPAETDNIATVRIRLNQSGSFTLKNGAVVTMTNGDEEAGTAGNVTITDPDGAVYQAVAEDSTRAANNKALTSLFAAYQSGDADQFKQAVETVEPPEEAQVIDTPPPASEADAAAQNAINFLQNVLTGSSDNLTVLREQRNGIRSAYQALKDAGVYEENEDLLNQAVKHNADQVAAVAQGAK